eukprot:1765564-Pyramimonas_sp.AAC.1
MVGWASVIGCVLKIPPVAMGITVLAAGTSIPDALGSIAVAKQGQVRVLLPVISMLKWMNR